MVIEVEQSLDASETISCQSHETARSVGLSFKRASLLNGDFQPKCVSGCRSYERR